MTFVFISPCRGIVCLALRSWWFFFTTFWILTSSKFCGPSPNAFVCILPARTNTLVTLPLTLKTKRLHVLLSSMHICIQFRSHRPHNLVCYIWPHWILGGALLMMRVWTKFDGPDWSCLVCILSTSRRKWPWISTLEKQEVIECVPSWSVQPK